MIRFTLVLLVLSLLPGFFAEAFAGTIQCDWHISMSDICLSKEGSWDRISLDEGIYLLPDGYPALPAVSMCYVIPQQCTLSDVCVANIVTEQLGDGYRIIPSGTDRIDYNITQINGGINSMYPITGFKTGRKTGYRLGSFSFIPFYYDISSGNLSLITSADIVLSYEIDPEIPVQTLSENQINLATSCLEIFVENPEYLACFAPHSRAEREEDIEVVVIGNISQENKLNELVSFHNQMGYESEFVSLQWIYSNIDGFDVQEKIRNHLQDLYLDNGLNFAVIVGDSGITTRMSMLCGPERMEPMASCVDLYFSDLDGTWDADGDHLYGESSDEIDYYSDIYVGRYPVNPGENSKLAVMVSNFDEYHFSQLPGDWQTSALLIGSELNAQGSDWTYGSMYCDTLESIIPPEWNITLLCTDTTGYHPSNQVDILNDSAVQNNSESPFAV